MAGFSRILSCSLVLFLFLSLSEARDHLVGDKMDAWKIPTAESNSLNHWAQKSRFLIGDTLVWKYNGSEDSVLEVTKRDYVTCNTSTPIQTHNDGNTKVKLEHSGPYYFISGAEGHCEKGQKLIVVVISDKHGRLFKAVSPASAPSPVEFDGPAVAPTSSATGLVNSSFWLALWALAVFLVM